MGMDNLTLAHAKLFQAGRHQTQHWTTTTASGYGPTVRRRLILRTCVHMRTDLTQVRVVMKAMGNAGFD